MRLSKMDLFFKQTIQFLQQINVKNISIKYYVWFELTISEFWVSSYMILKQIFWHKFYFCCLIDKIFNSQ